MRTTQPRSEIWDNRFRTLAQSCWAASMDVAGAIAGRDATSTWFFAAWAMFVILCMNALVFGLYFTLGPLYIIMQHTQPPGWTLPWNTIPATALALISFYASTLTIKWSDAIDHPISRTLSPILVLIRYYTTAWAAFLFIAWSYALLHTAAFLIEAAILSIYSH